MSDEVGTMLAAITAAIEDFLARKGGGLQTGFVYAVDVIDADGSSVRYLGSPNDQELYRSLGLTEYLRKYLDLEVADEIGAQAAGPCSCDECEDE